MATVEETCVVDASPETTFSFFRRPELVLGISDPSVGAKLVESPEILSTGDRMMIELMAFGMVRKVVYEATINEGDLTMVELMVEGDLKQWSHLKEFHIDGSGCRVVDRIEFEPPGGMAAFLLPADKIAAHVTDNLAYRNERLGAALSQFSVES